MIEISHKQAQHLIREGQDRRLPEEQWAVLYSHLESCPECCAYQQRLANYERDLHRCLQARWSAARGPAEGVAPRIITFRAQRKRTTKLLRKASLYLFGMILLAGYLAFRLITAPPPRPTPTPEVISAAEGTPTPNPLQTMFYGLVLLESHRDGNAEIYLLKASPAGPQMTNLTQNPAQDTRPAWSPDGEWIAFLSDRTGKNEIHIMHVAGSRLTQVTNVPGIEWIGPLEWSYDGKWLGLAGRKGGQNGPSFLYLVPLDGSGEPRSIAFTYNAGNGFRFSPAQSALAYLTDYRPGGIDVVNIANGWTGAITLEDNQALHFITGQEAAFDWSLGGRSMVYTTNPEAAGERDPAGSTGSQIRLSPEIEIYSHQDFTGAGAKTVDALEAPLRFRAVSWVPHSLMVAGLAGGYSGPDDCWMVRLSNAYNSAQSPRVLPELCVVGGLSQANWTSDGKWMVVIGRKPDEQTPALYAMRLPDVTGRADTSRETTLTAGVTYIERLADLPAEDLPTMRDSTGHDLSAEPRVRPGGTLLHFTPRAAPSPEPTSAPVALPGELPGWVVYSVQQGADSWIE
ncbi:MAG: hypothetical protein EHM21_11340, partial [Chloroflexi bacterium]